MEELLYTKDTQGLEKCAVCNDIQGYLTEKSSISDDFILCIEHLDVLVKKGKFELLDATDAYFITCPLSEVKDPKSGKWAADLIAHRLRCTECGQIYDLAADTYHGSWSLTEAK